MNIEADLVSQFNVSLDEPMASLAPLPMGLESKKESRISFSGIGGLLWVVLGFLLGI
jgi:hypothetical protein